VFDYIPFPVFTHSTGMTHFQNVLRLISCLLHLVLDCPFYVIFLMLNIYVADQDQGLEALSKVISRQKEIAETIGSEVDLQNGKLCCGWVILSCTVNHLDNCLLCQCLCELLL